MTDAQFSILLYQYAARLTAMIDAAEAALPDDVKTERSWLNLLKPPEYKTIVKETEALDNFRNFAQELKQDSELLEHTAKGEKPQPR